MHVCKYLKLLKGADALVLKGAHFNMPGVGLKLWLKRPPTMGCIECRQVPNSFCSMSMCAGPLSPI
jgi:hypothetical protein